MLGFRAIELFDQTSNFFLGFCTFVGAAFAYQRSGRAAVFVAIAGLSFMIGAVMEFGLMHMNTSSLGSVVTELLFALTNAGRHVGFFGGLALALRAVAAERVS